MMVAPPPPPPPPAPMRSRAAPAPPPPVVRSVPLMYRRGLMAARFRHRVTPPVAPTPEPTHTQSGLPIVDTEIWGPPLWFILHTLGAFADQPAVLAAWAGIPGALDGSLPCPLCETHFHAWRSSVPDPSGSGDAVRTWLLDLHNAVNVRNEAGAWTMEQVMETYLATEECRMAAVERLAGLRGVIGEGGWAALEAALTVAVSVPQVIVSELTDP